MRAVTKGCRAYSLCDPVLRFQTCEVRRKFSKRSTTVRRGKDSGHGTSVTERGRGPEKYGNLSPFASFSGQEAGLLINTHFHWQFTTLSLSAHEMFLLHKEGLPAENLRSQSHSCYQDSGQFSFMRRPSLLNFHALNHNVTCFMYS